MELPELESQGDCNERSIGFIEYIRTELTRRSCSVTNVGRLLRRKNRFW